MQWEPGPNSATRSACRITPDFSVPAMPSVIKATAIVNGEVITQTDVDQRLALLVIANEGSCRPTKLSELRQQVLRNLIDETLQIQAAKTAEIKVTDKDIDSHVRSGCPGREE